MSRPIPEPMSSWDHPHLGQKVGVRWPDGWRSGVITTFDRNSRTLVVTLDETGSKIQIENPAALRPMPEGT